MTKEEKIDHELVATFIEIQEMEKAVEVAERNLAYMKKALSRMKQQLLHTKSELLKL